jgi:hypothetical protein
MRVVLLTVSLFVNLAVPAILLSPGLVMRANPHLEGITYPHCSEPETQRALLAAALQGEERIYASLPNANYVLGLLAANLLVGGYASFRKAPKPFVQADRCGGLRYYHAVASSGRLTQALGPLRKVK